ncbi:MAG: DUF2399 domain-containing protein [Desulfovermiculus sp.]|nr:DUF2399 domain-containing protein [Desulfovermiculus sp.]
MSSALTREHLTTSRTLEFFSGKELSMQLGESDPELWPIAIIKELIDNSLDACEMGGILPLIEIETDYETFVSVQDNGPGLPEEVIRKSLDYTIRVSDKNFYISPSRGQLGNALKCVWAMPYVLNGEDGSVQVDADGKRHSIHIKVDKLAQIPAIDFQTEDQPSCKKGTKITLMSKYIAGYLEDVSVSYFYKSGLRMILEGYSLANPHAEFRLNDEDVCHRTVDKIDKWTPDMPISIHWYSENELENIVAGYLSNEKDVTIREFMSGFKGLASTVKQKKILDALDMQRGHLSNLMNGDGLDRQEIISLLREMQDNCQPVKAKALGMVGSEHIEKFVSPYCEHFQYKSKTMEVNNIPYVIEVAFAMFNQEHAESRSRNMRTALNWSAGLRVPTPTIENAMSKALVNSEDPVFFFIHIISPKLEFSDRGKSQLSLPEEVRSELRNKIVLVARQWTKLKREADREGRVKERERERLRQIQKHQYMNAKEAAYQVMREAYLKASGNGKYPANARQIMYAARPQIIELTGKSKPWKESAYFTQTLLNSYIADHPKETAEWDVVFDARGNFVEPHTQKSIPLGTLAVRRYISTWLSGPSFSSLAIDFPTKVETSGPDKRFNKVLFVEKEGFNELLAQAKFAERYDMAIMSTKGMSVTASRMLVERLSAKGATIYVLRDFDKAGFSIVHTLKSDSFRYQFKAEPDVIDLGLRLEDVQEMELETEKAFYESNVSPKDNLFKNGATIEEAEFLVSGGYPGNWSGERVEINAMTSEQIVEFLDRKLTEAGAEKIVPSNEDMQDWYVRAYKQILLERKVQDHLEEVADMDVDIPEELKSRVQDILQAQDSLPWDNAVYKIAKAEAKK